MGRYSDRAKQIKHKNLQRQVYDRLTAMFRAGKGHSRHADKRTGEDRGKIYSEKTYTTYRENCYRFLDWLKSTHPGIKDLGDTRQYVDEYLQAGVDEGLSPYTLKLHAAALAKLFQCSMGEFIQTPPRHYADVTRSRGHAVRDAHISAEKEAFYGRITAATGLRRREFEHIRGTDLIQDRRGRYWLHIHEGTKGGRERWSPLCPKDAKDRDFIVAVFQRSGEGKVCDRLPSSYDNHHYRDLYATRIYNALARPLEDIPREDRYYMRGARKGTVLDRQALRKVGRFLGHGEGREDLAAQHYIL